ncbi:MAG: prolyl oligopeptidase family serine peptidase [Sphingomonas bacterium]|nr:prolyl oligopeptidase family serine peptidase [Sphingomonas bacterium]
MRKMSFVLAAAAAMSGLGGVAMSAVDDDPYIWLEEFTSPRVNQWIAAHNAPTFAELEADPRYKTFYDQALSIAEAKDRNPTGRFLGGRIYNFWQDADHVRGIWRRTSAESYASAAPVWETVLDLDALSRAEKANWVWKGADCSRPAERRCLISLSDGGEDAVTMREYDIATKSFVAGGFTLPKGKQVASWVSENELLVSREWEPGLLTKSGYAYVVKSLKRGQPLGAAREVYRGTADDVAASGAVLRDGQGRILQILVRATDFFHNETFVLTAKGPRRLVMPERANLVDMIDGRVIIQSQEAWTPVGATTAFPAGSLLSVDLSALKADPARLRPTLIYAPAAREALQGASATKGMLIVSILDNVRGRTLLFKPGPNGGWTRSALDLPDNSTIGVADASNSDNRALFSVTSFLTPPSQWLVDAGQGTATKFRQQPPKFDSAGLVSQQFEATSSDGTKVPYFVVHRGDMKFDGNNPTLLYAYGGFEVSQTPSYGASTGKLWLERGGVYVLANIRGGGEFGPAWHEAGLKTKRQIVYDDFAAIGRDLVARKITSARRLGIKGGSNGGLLTGVAFTQSPELWNAVVIDIPLLDMLRIAKIAAGASWEGEYGSVSTDPAVRKFWKRASPYHNLTKGKAYPVPFIYTTTKDDRTGPQHARKFAARMEEYGLPFYYYENTEGGHAAGANLKQQARTQALQMVYLTRKLMGPVEPKR